MTIHEIRTKLEKLAGRKIAEVSKRFFKTGPREYGEGDVFLGIRVPVLRKLAKEYQTVTTNEAQQLLKSSIHEERLLALFILVGADAKGDESARKSIYELYLKNTQSVNNWDLVDGSAEHIVGAFLMDKSKKPLKGKDLILKKRIHAQIARYLTTR